MGIEAYYDDDNDVVVVTPEKEGEVTTEVIKYAAGLAMKTAGEHRCDSLLFDITRMRQAQSLVQGFWDMNDLGKTTGLTFQYKCAVVYNPSTYSTGRAEYIEAVVTNRPNPLFKMFRSLKEAIEWLKES